MHVKSGKVTVRMRKHAYICRYVYGPATNRVKGLPMAPTNGVMSRGRGPDVYLGF